MGLERPDRYGLDRVETLARRLTRGRASWERWGAVWCPGVPLPAVVALSVTSSGPMERGGPPDFVIGCPNVEAARARAWYRDGSMGRDLGRVVDPDDATDYASDRDAQIWAGLRTYAEHRADLAAKHPELLELQPAAWDCWDYRCAVVAYSSGTGAAAALLAPAAERLAATPRADRWPLLARLIVATPGPRWGDLRIAGKWRAAYMIPRADGRVEAGRELARHIGAPRDWWGPTETELWTALIARTEVE